MKRTLCLFWALVICFTVPAAAQGAYRAEITGEIVEWNAFDDAVTAVFQDWAKNASLQVTADETSADASLAFRGDKILGLHDSPAGMGIFPGGLLITGDVKDKQRLLGDAPTWLVLIKRLPCLVKTAAHMGKAVPALLAPYAQEEKANFEVKNVGRAAKRVTYALRKEDWAACLPSITDETIKALKTNGADDELLERSQAWLAGLQFDQKGTLKRFMNKEGVDIAWQFAGTVSLQGKDARAVKLTIGYSDRGLYVKGRFPAVQGNNDCRIALSAASKKQKLTLDGSIKRMYEGKSEQYKADAALDVSKGVQGTVSLTLSPAGARATVWRLRPDFLKTSDTLNGTLASSMQRDRRKASFVLKGEISPADTVPAFSPLITMSAAHASTDRVLGQTLAPVVLSLINSAPIDQQMAVMHALGRHRRTQGASISLQSIEHSSDTNTGYLVEEVQKP